MLKIVHVNIKPKSEKQARKERIAKYVELLMNESKKQKEDVTPQSTREKAGRKSFHNL